VEGTSEGISPIARVSGEEKKSGVRRQSAIELPWRLGVRATLNNQMGKGKKGAGVVFLDREKKKGGGNYKCGERKNNFRLAEALGENGAPHQKGETD